MHIHNICVYSVSLVGSLTNCGPCSSTDCKTSLRNVWINKRSLPKKHRSTWLQLRNEFLLNEIETFWMVRAVKLFKKVYIKQFYAITQFFNHSWHNIIPICKFYCKFSIHIIVFAKWAIGNKMFSRLYKICNTFYGFLERMGHIIS